MVKKLLVIFALTPVYPIFFYSRMSPIEAGDQAGEPISVILIVVIISAFFIITNLVGLIYGIWKIANIRSWIFFVITLLFMFYGLLSLFFILPKSVAMSVIYIISAIFIGAPITVFFVIGLCNFVSYLCTIFFIFVRKIIIAKLNAIF